MTSRGRTEAAPEKDAASDRAETSRPARLRTGPGDDNATGAASGGRKRWKDGIVQTWLVAGRDIDQQLHSRSFLITTLLLLLATVAGVVIAAVLTRPATGSDTTTVVAVAAELPSGTGLADDFTLIEAASANEAVADVRDGEADAAVIPDAAGGGLTIVARTTAPSGLVNALTTTPTVELLEPDTTGTPMTAAFTALGFGAVFMIVIQVCGAGVAQNTVIEKQTRIVEILLAAMPARVLIAGKILGSAVVALLQALLLALVLLGGMAIAGMTASLAAWAPAILWFVVLLITGFVLITSLYAALAALVSRVEEVSSATTPVTMLVMVAYLAPYIVILLGDEGATTLLGYLPVFSTIVMPTLISSGTATSGEAALAWLICLVATVGGILVAARVYRYSLLRTGKKVSFFRALSGSE
ncbi:MAG: ABC transporter permease [Propionibacteriaceae bacterium]|jgi:ABC-2 type transport system permease protein|nr:ABC transporter permease [Propionibacteriaceae bacterium]